MDNRACSARTIHLVDPRPQDTLRLSGLLTAEQHAVMDAYSMSVTLLPLFERAQPNDTRRALALERVLDWRRGGQRDWRFLAAAASAACDATRSLVPGDPLRSPEDDGAAAAREVALAVVQRATGASILARNRPDPTRAHRAFRAVHGHAVTAVQHAVAGVWLPTTVPAAAPWWSGILHRKQ
jgi:hypothetical protein